MAITRLVPIFGANAAHAELPARMLAGSKWVYIPFAGSFCEVPHFDGSVQVMLSDVNDELITLARIVAYEGAKDELARRLVVKLFHPAELEEARAVIRAARESRKAAAPVLFGAPRIAGPGDLDIATAYFVVAWMGRSAVAGTRGEETVGLALRYDAGGGDPVVRFKSAVQSLEAWGRVLRRCAITREDVFDVLARLHKKVTDPKFRAEAPGNRLGLYADPPWPDDGDSYLHTFTEAQQRRLAAELAALPHVRIVMRFADHPLVRELYPEAVWEWRGEEGRDQHRKGVREVFLEKRRSGA